jgi:hypothetical protein
LSVPRSRSPASSSGRARLRLAACPVAILAAGWATVAVAQDGELALRSGIERTSGDYGGTQEFSDLYVPLTVLYERRKLGFRATLPWLEVEFADTATSSTYKESGLGDVVLGLTVYDVYRSSDGSVAVDLTNKVKVGTADEQKGLGTGETDLSVQADIYKFLGRSMLVATLGYKFRGEPDTFVIDDTWLAAVGGYYRFSNATSGGLFLDYRQSSVPGFEGISELTASLSQTLSDGLRVQGYLVHCLSDASLDWGAGLSLRLSF